MAIIKRVSLLTGSENTMDLPVKSDRVTSWLQSRLRDPCSTPLIQDAFPELNNEQREFILTGSTGDEWERLSDEL
tara:strand:- start:14057 stop:14281 length:225 start_codon:yes stop_codon:yes gene_type:complete